MSATIKYNDSKRLVYLEPNNIETVNGVSVTPDYTDYSIMFRLMADVVNRMDAVGVDGSSNNVEKIGITWVSANKNGETEKVYFTNGSKIDNSKRNYYTTYYTDINYRDLSDNDVIEGLGVESVDIALENFYAASVKIKFVDVRGSTLFAKEEAMHKNTRLTAENVYGCFFTMPYPKFTLQVKGFYGKAMTYQLTCIGFNGSFDSNSGNFTAEASFIGYDFSCLSDLPLRYVILSNCDNEIGRAYWDKHVAEDKSWELIGPDGPEKPQRLLDIYKFIKNAIASDSNFNTDSYVEEIGIVDANIAIEDILKVKKCYEETFLKFINNIKNNKYNFTIDEFTHTGFDDNGEIIDFNGKTEFSISSKSNTFNNTFNLDGPNFTDLFDYIWKYEKIHSGEKIEYSKEKLKFNKGVSVYSDTTNLYTIVFNYDDGGLYRTIIEKIKQLETLANGVITIGNDAGSSKEIKEIVKFTPYIGNVIKTVLCHVETFIHTVYQTTSNIYDEMIKGSRVGKNLGITINNTDIPRLSVLGIQKFADEDIQIPPFPNIIVSEDGNDPETENTFAFERCGWPGDIGEEKINWREYSLVKSYAEASQRRTSDPLEKTGDMESSDVNDLMCASYIFFKSLWDRWLVSGNINEFSAENLYKRFVFVDSFYRSVEWKLHTNLDILLDCIENKDAKSTVYTMLREIAKKHNCMFFAYGDTISFTEGYSKDNSMAIDNIKDIFTPIPYKSVKEASSSNKIVMMYHNKPASNVETGFDEYSDDNMYFSDGENLTEFSNKAFASVGNSYVVPSFCVMYGKLSNSIFTDVKVNMEVPTVTNQTISSLKHISDMYSASERKVSFYGQDLFPVYSNFSYICEFEMLGDTQITPLMYFQLFNMPMFRGVYMIFSVKHSIKQGNMVTTVKGMRMSKHAIPFSKKWFSDGAEKIFSKYRLTNKDTAFMKAEEYEIVMACKKYKNGNAVEIVFNLDNIGYLDPAETKKHINQISPDNYSYNLIENSVEENEDLTNVWEAINEMGENIKNGMKVSSFDTHIKSYMTNKYKSLNISSINDVFIETHILAHAMLFSNIDPVYDALEMVSDKKYDGSNFTQLTDSALETIKSVDKENFYSKLQQSFKAKYGSTFRRNEELRNYLLERVNRCTNNLKNYCDGE